MQIFIATVLSHVPAWVWVILAFIALMGWLQSRDQQPSRARVLILPLLWAGFGAWGIQNTFGLTLMPWLAWAAGLLLGAGLIIHSGWPGLAGFNPSRQRFFVPGSWLPLALMLGIFLGKFALGMSLALHAELAGSTSFAVGFSSFFGLLGGVFLGRSRNILRCATIK